MTLIEHLPKSIVTILRDFAFPNSFSKDGIRKAVHCREDLTIITSEISEQMQIAATLALLNSRLANTSAMIVVRTTREARLIYQFLNPMDNNQIDQDFHEYDFSHRLVNSTIRVASTFMKFKGNCYPSRNNCIIVTSYNHLLRNLLYRRSNLPELKKKVSLPLVSTYIFVDPLHENRNQVGNIFDSILFLKRKCYSLKNRMHFISPGTLSKAQLKKAFQTKTIIEVNDFNPKDFDFSNDTSTRDLIKSYLPFQILLQSFSGHPTKQQLLNRLKESIFYKLQVSKNSHSTKSGNLDNILEDEFQTIFESLTKINQNFESEEALALISHGDSYTGRYYLTPFGKKFLLASTYFEEIQNDPLTIITLIQEKISNKILEWEGIAQIFHTFTIGRIAYDDLQVLIEKLETKELSEEDACFKSIFSASNSYSFFKIHKLLSCFQETMSETAKKRFSLIGSTISSNFYFLDVVNGIKDKAAILQAIKEELILTSEPLTITQIMMNLSIQKEEVTEALKKMELQSESFNTIIVKPPKGRRVKYYSIKEIPSYFFKECGNCYFYGSTRCNYWTEVAEIAERKIPEKYLPYLQVKKLQRKTVGCEFYQEAITIDIKIPVAEFHSSFVPKDFVDFTGEDGEEFAHYCPFCLKDGEKVHIKAFGSAVFPQQGAKPNKCPRCNSSFKLIQEKLEPISEKINDEY
ncbi:MAG: hypothetical protein HZR80_07025 [Candidatus Heimdallarchaeota archaeon]